jgi:hypothetical protein
VTYLATATGYSERTVQRALAEARRYRWLLPHRSPRGTVAGQLRVGTDRESGSDPRVCQADCDNKLTGKYANAIFCSDRCRKAASRVSERRADAQVSGLHVAEGGSAADLKAGQKRHEGVTLPTSEAVEDHADIEIGTDVSREATGVPGSAVPKGEPSQPDTSLRSGTDDDDLLVAEYLDVENGARGSGGRRSGPPAQVTTPTGKDHPESEAAEVEGGDGAVVSLADRRPAIQAKRDAKRAEVRRLHGQGYSRRAIAAATGMPLSWVGRWLKENSGPEESGRGLQLIENILGGQVIGEE